eukprot:1872830-Amphidinium_carterae.1
MEDANAKPPNTGQFPGEEDVDEHMGADDARKRIHESLEQCGDLGQLDEMPGFTGSGSGTQNGSLLASAWKNRQLN